MCNSNSASGCGFPFLYHMSVSLLRGCMEALTKPLSNEKVVRPALVYSLFPNVPPTIYFGTRDEKGKPGQVFKPRRAPRRRMLAKLEGSGKGWEGLSGMAVTVLGSPPGSWSDMENFFLSILKLTLLNPITSCLDLAL